MQTLTISTFLLVGLLIVTTSACTNASNVTECTNETKNLLPKHLDSMNKVPESTSVSQKSNDENDIDYLFDDDSDDSSNRRHLLGLKKVIKKIFHSPPPAPKAAPAPAPKAAPVPKVVIVQNTPQSIAQPLSIYLTCDNEFDLYVNGEKVGKGNDWRKTYHFTPNVKVGDVIAIDGVDHGGPAAFIGVFGNRVTKPSDWRCSLKETKGWNKNIFYDTDWFTPTSYGRNQDNNIWRLVSGGSRPNIPSDAEWLWSNNNNNHDKLFCRYFHNFNTPKTSEQHVATFKPDESVKPSVSEPAKPVSVKPSFSESVKQLSSSKSKPNLQLVHHFSNHSSSKLEMLKSKVEQLFNEMSKDNEKQIYELSKNLDGSNQTLNQANVNYQNTVQTLNRLKTEIVRLNSTLLSHYYQMVSDSKYLERLEMIKPQFLNSLASANTKLYDVEKLITVHIVESTDKNQMMQLVKDIRNTTHYSTNDLSKQFLDHYEKYKKVIKSDSTQYSLEKVNLEQLVGRYSQVTKFSHELYGEYKRIYEIVNKLRRSMNLSREESKMFKQLLKSVTTILSKKSCVAPEHVKFTGFNNTKCATELLHSHVENKLVY